MKLKPNIGEESTKKLTEHMYFDNTQGIYNRLMLYIHLTIT